MGYYINIKIYNINNIINIYTCFGINIFSNKFRLL